MGYQQSRKSERCRTLHYITYSCFFLLFSARVCSVNLTLVYHARSIQIVHNKRLPGKISSKRLFPKFVALGTIPSDTRTHRLLQVNPVTYFSYFCALFLPGKIEILLQPVSKFEQRIQRRRGAKRFMAQRLYVYRMLIDC